MWSRGFLYPFFRSKSSTIFVLNNYIINIVSSTKFESNLSKSEAIGIKSLKKRDNISITISDKGGDFVVTFNNFQDYITQHHINSNPDVYKFVPPTRRYCSIIKEIANPTENTFRLQIKNKIQLLEELCNDKLWELTNDKIQDWRFHKNFSTHHSSLPTMYVMLKTGIGHFNPRHFNPRQFNPRHFNPRHFNPPYKI